VGDYGIAVNERFACPAEQSEGFVTTVSKLVTNTPAGVAVSY
jgi:hypothetical protein